MSKLLFRVPVLVMLGVLCVDLSVALETARMELPETLEQQSLKIDATGFGGRNKGTYSIGSWHGNYTRGESRLGIFDPLWVSNKGKSSFTVAQAGFNDPLEAQCEMAKGSVTVGIVTFDPRKMRYQCDFRRAGELQNMRLVMGQPKRENMKERFLANDTRAGEAALGTHHVTFRSVHRYRNSRFTSQAPIGYVLHSSDAAVAAVELTDWNPTVYFADGVDSAMQESILIVALAIAVLRDPANSALED